MQYSLLGTSMLGQFLILAVAGFLIMNGQIGIGVVMSVGNLSGTVTNYSKSVANSLILLNATGKLLEKYGKITDESKVTDGEEAVSYTHLDVYKRQILRGQTFPKNLVVESFFSYLFYFDI